MLTDEELMRSTLDTLENEPMGKTPEFTLLYELFEGERRRIGESICVNDYRERLLSMQLVCSEVSRAIRNAREDRDFCSD